MDILEKLKDLLKQATTERSHYYVAATVKEAIAEIERLTEKRKSRSTKARANRAANREIREWVRDHIG